MKSELKNQNFLLFLLEKWELYHSAILSNRSRQYSSTAGNLTRSQLWPYIPSNEGRHDCLGGSLV